MPDAHGRLQDKVTDKAGRFPSRGATHGGGMSIGENHNLSLDTERRLVKQIATGITEIVADSNGDVWYFAAPSTIHQRVLDELTPDIRGKLAKTVTADLVNLEKSEILGRF